jgi:hypothetical protein
LRLTIEFPSQINRIDYAAMISLRLGSCCLVAGGENEKELDLGSACQHNVNHEWF